MMLFYGRSMSAFSSETKYKQDSIRYKAFENAASNGGEVDLGLVRPVTNERIIILNKDKKVLTEAPFQRNTYLITESLEIIKWEILTSTKKINGYNCQKAICTFKGRNYEAWFTPEIPFSFGPWKLNGLPGLILDVSDIKKEVQFTAVSIHNSPKRNIMVNENVIPTTKTSFNKMMLAFMDGSARTADPSNGDSRIEGISLRGYGNKKGNININNPIDKGN
jgi:GLPGLI family protein